jgi:hypothetical protein
MIKGSKLDKSCALVGLVLLGMMIFVACGEFEQTAQQKDRATQEELMKSGQSSEPVYQIQNFLARKAINRWSRRMDTPNKLWYVYLMTESGAFIGYHICETIPLSYGVSLTNPMRVYTEEYGDPVMPAPGVDSVFYSGTDPSVHYCFDAETDTLVTFNTKFVHYDRPLNVDAPRLRLEVESVE